jgi:FkbH-like protein
MTSLLDLPLDAAHLLRKKNSIRRELLLQPGLTPKRIAVLGGSTTAEVVDQLEIFLLLHGINATFYQSEYGQYYEDALFPRQELVDFKPELIYVHTTSVNVQAYPAMRDDRDAVLSLLENQLDRFRAVWDGIERHFKCPILQNNFEEPWQRPLGNLDATDFRGRSRFISDLNAAFVLEAEKRKHLYIHDIHYLSARLGMDHWFNPRLWYLYKYALEMEMIPHLARQLAAVMAALWGKTNKCLVLDLDNTLWGGVIGDDGLHGIRIGTGNAEAEAHTDLQRYARELKDRGIILAVCSKNEEENARAGFMHQDSILRQEDFTAFQANWDPKSQNIELIAREVNIGIDSLVFVDDNPAEREIVRAQLPQIKVPDIGSEVTDFVRILDRGALFETVSLSAEDLARSQQYHENNKRGAQQAQFATYDDFLASLQMRAEIAPFNDQYRERITQLINKTNQFNLTTMRCTEMEVEQMAASPAYITLYGRLRDNFGDNGLIAVTAGKISGSELHIDLWLMSCRVLKRGMEDAMLERLCQLAVNRGMTTLIGYYRPTQKNKMVAGFYSGFGFEKISETEGQAVWKLDLAKKSPTTKHVIEVVYD